MYCLYVKGCVKILSKKIYFLNPFSWMFPLFEMLTVLKSVGSHILQLHREPWDDDRDTHDPYPAQRSERIPQWAWPRSSTAFRERPRAGVDMCAGGTSGLITKDYHMASPCSTHPARLPVCWRSLWPGRDSALLFGSPCSSYGTQWDWSIYPLHSSQVWSGVGRPSDKSQLPCIDFSISNNIRLLRRTAGGLCAVQTRFLHPISSDNKHLEQCAIVWACDSERVNCNSQAVKMIQ